MQEFATALEPQTARRAPHSESETPELGDSCADITDLVAMQTSEEPEAALASSADSCTMLVSFAEPVNANPSLMNLVFKSVEVGGFTLAVDYIPSAVRWNCMSGHFVVLILSCMASTAHFVHHISSTQI